MKAFALITLILTAVLSSSAQLVPLEKFSPHFSTNAPIIWQAPMNDLPKSFWTYKRLAPRPFSTKVISNAMVLASLRGKRIPKASTRDFFMSEDKGANYPGMIPVFFSIRPKFATIAYWMPLPDTNLVDLPADEVLVRRAWASAALLGVDPAQIAMKEMTSSFNHDENYNDLTNQLRGRGVFLSRLLDGILFTGSGDNGGNDGFWIEFGSHGQIRAFSLVWPGLRRYKLEPAASPEQIIAGIRAFKTTTLPNRHETNYFARVKSFANAIKVTVTKITPYYSEWADAYGEMPADNQPSKIIAPIAELEAVADFGNSNVTVRLFSPVLSSKVTNLLRK